VRAKKVALIISVNRAWRDLSAGWYGKENCRDSSPRQVGAQNDRGRQLRSPCHVALLGHGQARPYVSGSSSTPSFDKR
jgi:hypothetical protein